MITLITGNHLRHMYLVDSFLKIFKNITWIIQKSEKFIPEINKNFSTEIQKLQKIHFEKRQEAENKGNKIFEIEKEG